VGAVYRGEARARALAEHKRASLALTRAGAATQTRNASGAVPSRSAGALSLLAAFGSEPPTQPCGGQLSFGPPSFADVGCWRRAAVVAECSAATALDDEADRAQEGEDK
jgi:hypothetical protein